MGVITTVQEISCSIPVKQFFNSVVFGADEIMPKIIPHYFKSFETIHGDGGAGTIKLVNFNVEGMKPTKHRIDEIDEENHAYKYSVIEGGILGDDLESSNYVLKFESGGTEGGCSVKISVTYHPKSEDHGALKEKIEKLKKASEGFVKALEAHLLAQ